MLGNKLKALALCTLAATAMSASAVTVGQIDDFEAGNTANWDTGFNFAPPSNPPNSPEHVGSGGPQGDGDGYLKLTSNGAGGPVGAGGKLTAFNVVQWAGNYTATGITSIKMDVRNAGSGSLALRLGLLDIDELQFPTIVSLNFALSTNAVSVAADNVWHSIEFSLADLTAIVGTSAGALADVDGLRIFHSPSLTFPGPSSVSELHIDNITAVSAVPIPAAAWLLASGLALMIGKSRRRAA